MKTKRRSNRGRILEDHNAQPRPAGPPGPMFKIASIHLNDGTHGLSAGKKWTAIKNDEKREDNLLEALLMPAFRQAMKHTVEDAAFYIWHASATRRDFDHLLETLGLEEKQYITWVKDSFVLGHADYHWQTEPCYYAQRCGVPCRWEGDRKQKTAWTFQAASPAALSVSIANGIRLSAGGDESIFVSSRAPKTRKTRLIRLGDDDTMTVLGDHIRQAFSRYRPAIAYSGGADSTVLIDIVTSMGYKPPLIYADSQMEHETCLPFVRRVASLYRLELHVAKAPITPQQCWRRHGFPMLGKTSARVWMKHHTGTDNFGYRVDVSTCCRKMKILPARTLLKRLGKNASLTGLRGAQDDWLRGYRAHTDGAICHLKEDNIVQINPLIGWTDLMIRRYTRNHHLPARPGPTRNQTNGCMFCGGGAQFENSMFRRLRLTYPAAWRKMVIDFRFGEIILSIKHDRHLADIRAAIATLGGIETIADRMPHVFDFLRLTPLKGYDR